MDFLFNLLISNNCFVNYYVGEAKYNFIIISTVQHYPQAIKFKRFEVPFLL